MKHEIRRFLLVFLSLFLVGTAVAQSNIKNNFDHFRTGFPLVGAHIPVACESCHIKGIFKGTPTKCAGCHKGVIAQGKPSNHIPTSEPCENCHTTTSTTWEILGGFDHSGIRGNCASCHNGSQATGKNVGHIRSTNVCEACHTNTRQWTPVLSVDHLQVQGTCSTCHNNRLAVGKGPGHIPTNQECDVCHKSTVSWLPAGFDHSGVSANCIRCHAGEKPATHFPSAGDCGQCHQVSPLEWLNATFDHGTIAGRRCDSCHTGGFVGAAGKSANHIPTPPGMDCGSCHNTTDWSAATVDHNQITAACSSCHAGEKPVNHFPTTADCRQCHLINPLVWDNATFDHATTSAACSTCHNGTYAGAEGKPANHIPTNDRCEACHMNTDWRIVNIDHVQITNVAACGTCHAKDKTVTHFPTPPGQECGVCHSSSQPLDWTNATFDHANIAASRCDSCHNGGFEASGASGKGNNHVPTPAGVDCGACHNVSPATFTPAALFDHSQVTATRCDACHNGSFSNTGAPGKSANHPPTAAGADCGTCHKSTADFATNVLFDHANVTGNCASCHSSAKPANHIPIPAGVDCGACHTIPPATFVTATLFNHSQVTATRCDACHNGAFSNAGAPGKSANHPSTAPGQDCGACHKSTTDFGANVLFDHSTITGNCASCHGSEKPVNHIPVPAGLDCGACHTIPPATFANATKFDHALVTAMACNQCHNGSFAGVGALGTPPGHFATTVDCKNCHTTTAFTQVRFTHSSANYPGDHNPSVTCLSCHTGNSQAVTWSSAALKPFCAGCHQNDFDAGEHTKVQSPQINYTAAELKDCSGACHVYTNSSLTTIAQRRSGEHRPNDGGF